MIQKLVQVNMTEDTLKKINNVKVRIHSKSDAGAVGSSIAIADMVTEAMSNGANVIIEERNGTKFRITIPGVTKDD